MACNKIGEIVVKTAAPYAVKKALRWLGMPVLVVELGGLVTELLLDEE